MADPSELPVTFNETSANIQPNFSTTHANIEINQWINNEDITTLTEALTAAEQILGLSSPYNLRLFNNSVYVVDGHNVRTLVEDGAMISSDNSETHTIILNSANFGTPSQYAIYQKGLDEPLVDIQTTREEEVIISVAEEIYHLWDDLQGNIPEGRIDQSAGFDGKYDQKHEKDAGLFRIKLLAVLRPERWSQFQHIINNKDQYPDKLRLHWEKLSSQK